MRSADANVNYTERWATALVGAGALVLATRLPRARRPLAALSAVLLVRSATGFCPAYAAAGRRQATDTREALGGPRGSHLHQSITVAQPPEAVYALWHDLDRLAGVLPSNIRVERLDERRSRWTVEASRAGMPALASWTAEVINDEPGRLIAWRTVDEADVVSAGSVHFNEAPAGQGTEIHVEMQYAPPLGRAGANLARALGQGADRVVRQCLRDVKRYLELGRRVTLQAPSH